MDLGLRNDVVQSVLVDHTARLRMSNAHFVVIESTFTVTRGRQVIRLSPDTDPEDAFAPLRTLVGRVVVETVATRTGNYP